MADVTRSIADTSGFVPIYWAMRALDVLRSQIVATQFVTRDTDWAEAGWKGKQINVGYPGTFTTVAKADNTPVTPQAPVGGATVSLVLDQHRVVPFLVEDFGAAVANGSLMDRYLKPAVIALAEQIESDVLTQSLGFTGVAVGTAGTDMTAATVRAARKTLNVAKAPQQDRILIVSPKDEVALMGDSNLQSFFAFARPETVGNGVLGTLYGIPTAMSQLIATGGQLTLTTTGTLGGTYTVTFNGQTTAAIAFNASAATVQAALVAAFTTPIGGVVPTFTVLGTTPTTAGGTLQIIPTGSAYGTALPITTSGASLTGTAAAAAIGTTTNNLVMHKNAIMLAFRHFEAIPQGAGVMSAQVSDPESGLSLRMSVQYDVNNIGMRCNIDALYGLKVLRPTQGSLVYA